MKRYYKTIKINDVAYGLVIADQNNLNRIESEIFYEENPDFCRVLLYPVDEVYPIYYRGYAIASYTDQDGHFLPMKIVGDFITTFLAKMEYENRQEELDREFYDWHGIVDKTKFKRKADCCTP